MIRDIAVRDTGRKGKGVFALRDFRKGEFIFRRRHGRVFRETEFHTIPVEHREHFCELDDDLCALVLPPGCYLNHSCDPNAMRSGVKVFAWKTIRMGDEITIDYRLNASGGKRWPCVCGSANCLGYVEGGFFSLGEERQRSYLPYAPAFIRREYRRRSQSETPASTHLGRRVARR